MTAATRNSAGTLEPPHLPVTYLLGASHLPRHEADQGGQGLAGHGRASEGAASFTGPRL